MKKKYPKINVLVIILGMLFLVACEKDEGTGGTASISGTLKVKTYDRDYKVLQNESPAVDEDIFIIFGDDEVVGDNTSTNYNGNFKFSYLREGKYTIFYSTEDTVASDNSDTERFMAVDIAKGQDLDLGELFQIKSKDFNDGSASIKGQIAEQTFYRLSENTSLYLIDASPAKELEVYIESGDGSSELDRIRTNDEGLFEFTNLLKGDYRIYFYTEDTLVMDEKASVAFNVTVSEDGETIDLGPQVRYNRVDFDDGTSVIKGRIKQINYWKQSVYPNLIVQDTTFAQELEIYLTYGDNSFYSERIRTQDDGTFAFTGLIKGEYRVFLYSEDVSGGEEKLVIESNSSITGNGQIVDLGDLFIEQH